MSDTPKVMVVYGTRPEAIKVASVIKAVECSDDLDVVAVSTGQHSKMLDQVNEMFGITPDVDLQVLEPGQSLTTLGAKILDRMGEVIAEHKPDAVLVQGDTTTVAMAATAAFYHQVPVVHLEAGLRTANLLEPFPEEGNRRLVSSISSLHLAPTELSRANLERESIAPESIVVTGNTVIDALFEVLGKGLEVRNGQLKELLGSGREYILMTCHRRENWGESMRMVGAAAREIAKRFPDMAILFSVHSNPLVRELVADQIADMPNVVLTDSLPYADFVAAMNSCKLILTDSGGIQEEAPSLGKPVLLMRDVTERSEGVQAGVVRLVGTDFDRIVEETTLLLTDEAEYENMAVTANPFGDGHASERVVAAIRRLLTK